MTQQSNTPATLNSIQQFSFFNPEQFETMQRVATMFANSELVPDMYQIAKVGKEKAIANNIIAIDIANRIEANILMVMQNLVIIYGKPSWSSKFLISTVNTCGRFDSLKFKFKEVGILENYKYSEYVSEWKVGNSGKSYKDTKKVEKTLAGPILNIECVAYTCVKGNKEEILESAPVSIEMAINEGWYTKPGSKWPNMSKQMLMYRTSSFWTNAYAPELSMGMRTVEDVQDTIDIDFEEVVHKMPDDIKSKANNEEIDMDKAEETPPEQNKPQREAKPPIKEIVKPEVNITEEKGPSLGDWAK